jgi:hypothetical protein
MPVTDRVHSPTPEELMAFVDGESPSDTRAAIEAHVGGCDECRRLMNDLRGVTKSAALWAVEDAPATLQAPRPLRARSWALPALSWRPGYLVLSGGLAVIVLLAVGRFVPLKTTQYAASAARSEATPASAEAADKVSNVDGRAFEVKMSPQSQLESRPPAAPATVVPADAAVPRQPSVIRTATLRLVAKDFDAARASVEAIVAQAGGFLDQVTVNSAAGTARTLTGTVRVPANRLTDALVRLRQLGQVTEDTQGSEDVTDQIVDLDARLANARATEKRLNDILQNRTGKLSDVLDVERELARVRLEIERMDAERVNLGRRVSYATITLEIGEERKVGLEVGPLSLGTRLRVAAADGVEAALESVVGTVLFVLRAGPATIIWVSVAAFVWVLGRGRLESAGRKS